MRWWRKKKREVRYAGVLDRLEERINVRLKRWSNILQQKTDRLPRRTKLVALVVFTVLAGMLCAQLLINGLK